MIYIWSDYLISLKKLTMIGQKELIFHFLFYLELSLWLFPFSYVFKDIIICLIKIFIYNDLAESDIKIIADKKEELKIVNYLADGVIDMIVLICSVLLFIYLIVEKVKGTTDQMKN